MIYLFLARIWLVTSRREIAIFFTVWSWFFVCQDIRDILPTLIILFFGLLIMVLVIPYAFRNRDPPFSGDHTAKNQYRKFETNIPRKGIVRPQSQFPHSCVCQRFIYSHDRSAYSPAGNIGPIMGIYKSFTDTWMWKLGLRPRPPTKQLDCSGRQRLTWEMGFSFGFVPAAAWNTDNL